jgi:hypothetical protein
MSLEMLAAAHANVATADGLLSIRTQAVIVDGGALPN